MPSRPRSHVLEDLAEAKLRALTGGWILRAKGKDYGIDFEAEILAEDGSDTGALFYIQSKATDTPLPMGRKLKIKTDRLKYLTSFDAPAIIILYIVPDDTVRWMWAEHAERPQDHGKTTVTLDFDESHLWSDETPSQIERTLVWKRLLRRRDRLTSFPINTDADVPLALSRIAHRLRSRIAFAVDGAQSVPIKFSITRTTLTAEVEGIETMTSTVDPLDIDNVERTSLYLLAALLEKLNQSYHAARVARLCIDSEATTSDETLVATAAIALIRSGEPAAAVELALLNGLHDSQGFGHSIFRLVMQSPLMESSGLEQAVDSFYLAAIEAHELRSEPVGAVRYSYANNLMNRGSYRRAIHYYNGARRDDPGYLSRPYYLREVGGTLYLAGRYRASACFYQLVHEMSDDIHVAFCLGDAQLMAGRFEEAMQSLASTAPQDTALGAEARLKTCIAEWALGSGVSDVSKILPLLEIRDQ
jgi:tetratricopeptide (TPR) repeat protein